MDMIFFFSSRLHEGHPRGGFSSLIASEGIVNWESGRKIRLKFYKLNPGFNYYALRISDR